MTSLFRTLSKDSSTRTDSAKTEVSTDQIKIEIATASKGFVQ
jgi:hypothetical protein